ncbi:hypothetical protein FH972_016378 [Carpinus fangiana]|uniref:Uncharacterized protein n=1 Tax=Carpinus fangiana TaxID=176857 RepID=A0A5N6RG91_9ROSI|nr:hypothetical protein FH972_016378 [Carpinus fangiana]
MGWRETDIDVGGRRMILVPDTNQLGLRPIWVYYPFWKKSGCKDVGSHWDDIS